MKIHSTKGASTAPRWMACLGSVALCEQAPPQDSSSFADEGTCAHAVLEECLSEALDAKSFVGREIDGVEVTDEMASAVQVAIDWAFAKRAEVGGVLAVETFFNLEHLALGLFGTNDILIHKQGKHLVVADYKHGQSIVDVKENKQLLFYAVGAAETVNWEFETVELVIVQPRAPHAHGPIRSWTINNTYLKDWSKILVETAKAADLPGAPLVRGSWCGFCPAKGICPKMKEATEETLEISVSTNVATLPSISALSDQQIAKIIENQKLIEDFLSEVKRVALARLQSGEKIEGLKLVAGRGRREWIDAAQAEEFLIAKLGEDAFEKKLLSVAKAEKALGKKDVESLYADLAGAETVAPESDRRRAVEPLGGKLILNKKGASNA